MHFDARHNPAATAAREETRYSIQGVGVVELDGQQYLASTDGRVATLLPCTLDASDHPEMAYPVAAFDAARKYARQLGKGIKADKRHLAPKATLTVNGSAIVPVDDGQQEYKRIECRFPDVAAVVPKGAPEHRISLNVRLLVAAADAMGVDIVTLETHGQHVPVRIRPCYLADDDVASKPPVEPIGVIMPVDVDTPPRTPPRKSPAKRRR